jgi:uncharacterized protein
VSLHLNLHLTTACNMRCRYCYAPPQPGAPMSFDTARQALAFGARVNAGSCGIIFFGGEPLLARPLITDVVAEGRSMEARGEGRFHFKVTTNGLLMDESFIDFAVANDVLVALSFDGVREAHDAHRRTADDAPTFDVLRARLRLLLAARPYASVLMVLNPDTAAHLVESVDYLAAEGARYLIVSLNYAAPWTEADLDALEAEMARLADLYLDWSRAGRKFYLSPFEVKVASHVKGPDALADRCDLGRRQLSVDPAGNLYPCVQFARTGPDGPWCIGHVATGLDAGALTRIRARAALTPPACARCAISDRCHRTCGCLNWQTRGQVDTPSPVLCRYERMTVPLADRIGATLYRERNAAFLAKHYNPAYPLLSLVEEWGEARAPE